MTVRTALEDIQGESVVSTTAQRQMFYPHRPKNYSKREGLLSSKLSEVPAAADAGHLSPTNELTYQLTVIDNSDKHLE